MWQVEALPELASKGVEPIPTTPETLVLLRLFLSHYGSQLWVKEDLPLHKSVHNLAVTISETRLDRLDP